MVDSSVQFIKLAVFYYLSLVLKCSGEEQRFFDALFLSALRVNIYTTNISSLQRSSHMKVWFYVLSGILSLSLAIMSLFLPSGNLEKEVMEHVKTSDVSQ